MRKSDRAQELFPDLLEPFLGKPSSSVIPTAKDYGDDFDIIGLMKSAKDPDTGLMRDLKIEDGDLKHASSYYDYCFNVVGKDAHPPWMMQMWIAIMLFGEFCPVCSDKRWLSLDFMVNRVNVSTPSVSIVEHIQILKHGVCPKCKRHKHELMKKYGLKNYVELVNVLGQRCVTGDTLILTDRGLRYVEAFSHGRKKGFSPFSERLFNGREVEQASDFYVAQELEQVHRVTLANGADIKGTSDHPLRTLTGFKRIENLREGDYVAVSVNSQMWGTDIPSFADAFAKADVPTTKGVHTHVKRTSGYATLDWFTVLGLWVAEGRSTGITNFDPEVNSLIYNEYLKTYSKYHVRNVDQKYVKVMGSRGRRFLEYFLGDDLRRGSAKQHIPACVLAAPKQYVAAFLRGLYEGDGGFNGQTLSYYTISRRLAHELHALLLNFGFSPVIRKSRAWASNGSPKQVAKTTYTVSIVGFDIEAFGKEIGFITKRKRDLLTSRVSELHSREKHMPFTGDKLPPPVKDEVLTLLYTCTAALREIPLPTCLDGKGHAVDVKREFKGWKPRACIGRNTLLTRKPFYWNDPNFVEKGIVDLVKRLREHNVALTRPKLKRILDQLHHFKQFLPPKVLLDITHLESYLDKSVWWVRVSKINRNIGLRQTYDVTLPQTHQFVANGIINHNSGKSAQAASMGTYVTHRYLKFPRLADMTTAMQKSTELTGTFVSLTFSKAFSLLWTPYKNIIEDSQWYQDFHACLDVASEKYGLELYRKKDEFIKYYVKGLRIYPSGPKSQTLRGDTRFLAAIDELGLFPLPTGNEEEDEKSERANSDEAHKSLSNSLATVQAVNEQLLAAGLNPPPALLMGVSSPISMRDKVMRLLADSRTDEGKKYILGINLPTWKVNPHMPRSNPMIAKAYASNPEKAERDFGANPPRVSQTFMKSTQVPFSLFKHKNSHNLSYQYDEPGLLYPKLQRVWTPKFPSVVSLDAGHVNNSFSLTAGHFDFDRQKTVVSTVLEVMVHDLRAIDFNLTYKHLILPILKDLNAVLLLADQWQSLDLLSRAREDRGKNPKGKSRTIAVQHSPKRKSFDALAAMLSSGSIELPYLSQKDYDDVNTNYIDYTTLKDEPVKHLLLQMLTVRDPGPDKAPTKGEGFTDDMFRALVLLTKIHDPKVMERLSEARQWLKDEGSVGMPTPVFQPRFY